MPDIIPNWPLYIQPHMKMPIAIGTIHGGIVKSRNKERPGTAAFSMHAPNVPITIFRATEKNVQMKVRMMTSANRSLKIFS